MAMKKLTALASVTGALACMAAGSASASPMRLTGIQSAPDKTAGQVGDPCRALDPLTGRTPDLANTMAGSLIGCWYTDTFNQVQSSPNGAILAIGTEHFAGCLDVDRNRTCAGRDPRGTLALIYAFEGRFDKQGRELFGGCQHPIMSGTGAFAGARGRIDFTDNVMAGTSSYRGQLTLKKRPSHLSASASVALGPHVSIC
jgi:hypothetical protein